jgi:hypothetical protein
MTHQALALDALQPASAPHRTFFQRFGTLGRCVLPAEVLDDTTLLDPETGLPQPSLRQCCSQDGLCYAQIRYACSDGLYLADVAAMPNTAEAERVLFTEAQLVFALAWDERLFWRTPDQIRRLMQAQAEDLAPLTPHSEPALPAALFPAPTEPLFIVTTVEITPDELREAFDAPGGHRLADTSTHACTRTVGVCHVQQGLLRALARALQELLETAPDRYTRKVLHALTALVRHVSSFQQQTHQRVVNAVRFWDAESRGLAWALTLGVPQALLRAA